MIDIDGSYLEGGGQIIRTALTLSAITKKSVKIKDIRANRPKPGLAAQHLTCARAVRSICRGKLSHCEIGSSELDFEPGEIFGGRYEFNVGTAGSTILVAQTILPILIFAEKASEVRIVGGTHVMKSPSYDYFEKVFLPAVSLFGAEVNCELVRSGYYPRGGGEIKLLVTPSKLKGNEIWNGEEESHVIIRVSGLPISIGIREKKVFVQNKIEHVRVFEEEGDAGNAILTWSGFFGAYGLGEKGKRAEGVAQEVLDEMKKERGNADVDKHLADQLMIYAALAEGISRIKASEITTHSETNKYVIDKFLAEKIKINGNEIIVG
ncbi:RNA 3'-phosphate cyclase [Candidatus Micrarchaeota archaeon]|nr:RNA 3'-phosphate cyclase [Candidatus Micrarchaeota archaeon]